MFIGPIIIWYGPIISLTQNGWWGYDHEIMRPNILIRQLNSYTISSDLSRNFVIMQEIFTLSNPKYFWKSKPRLR